MPKAQSFPMTDDMLRRKIAAIAADSVKVEITRHAKQRMRQRHVLLPQVLHVLRSGIVVEPAHQNARGDWCCTLEKLTAGDLVKVPVCVETRDLGELVFVITVIVV